MTVCAVIPNWNRATLLRRLLDSLREQERRFDEIVVVDNGSTDDSVAAAEAYGVRTIRLDRNFGFAYAVNRGIESCRATYVAILNNDVVLGRGWLDTLLEAEADFACGLLLDEADPSRIDGTFDLVTSGGLAWRAGAGERASDPRWQTAREIQFAPLTAALFQSSVFERVGLLDESFGSYLEDVDLGIRCGIAGIRGRYMPAATATHRGSATLGAWQPETVRLLSRNQMLLIAKHYPRNWIWRYGCSAMAGQCMWGASAAKHGQFRAWLRGKREGLRAWRNRVPADGSVGEVFETSARQLRELAPGWFWKVNAWLS